MWGGGDVITFLEFAHTQRIGTGVLGLLHKLVALIPYGRAKCQVEKKENTKSKRNLEIISDCWNCDDCTTNECFPSPQNVVASKECYRHVAVFHGAGSLCNVCVHPAVIRCDAQAVSQILKSWG